MKLATFIRYKTPPSHAHLTAFFGNKDFSTHSEFCREIIDELNDLDPDEKDEEHEVKSEENDFQVRLAKAFPLGILFRELFFLDYMGAGMGGCGIASIYLLQARHSGVGLIVFLDPESDPSIIVSFKTLASVRPSLAMVSAILLADEMPQLIVANEALTTFENKIRSLRRDQLKAIWKKTAQKAELNVDGCLNLFDEIYEEQR